MNILVTGSNGFIGKNLISHLAEKHQFSVSTFTKDDPLDELAHKLKDADFVFHLAGVNRPQDDAEFLVGNSGLSKVLADAVISLNCKTPIVFSSSIQSEMDNAYGRSKRQAEEDLLALREHHGVPVTIFRLPNVFGKWARPNYNSVVATFCHNIARGLPIQINDPQTRLQLVYIDDVISHFVSILERGSGDSFESISPVYETTVGDLADRLQSFLDSRENLVVDRVGTGFLRALHATFLSYLPNEAIAYSVKQHSDERGTFVEMLKTSDSGQVSYFTALPGVTRGGHYHHTKTEKFLVITGDARFKFRHIQTGEKFEVEIKGGSDKIVETLPGWAHDITNIGNEKLIVMLWANEIFDHEKPDTYSSPLSG
ncbi:MAG: UDP-2-acetamido-2,6-beta-L-arabino-hexul-4-ose reductase [Candidatus Puniceispirillaceae bacterium]